MISSPSRWPAVLELALTWPLMLLLDAVSIGQTWHWF
jgi:hypothetical protein